MELKTAEQIRDEVSRANGFDSWNHVIDSLIGGDLRIARFNEIDSQLSKIYTLQIAEAACKEQRELCADETGLVTTDSKQLNSMPYQPFITDEDGSLWTINKQAILKTPQPDIDKLLK